MKLEEKRRVYEKHLICENNLGFKTNLCCNKCNFKTYSTVPLFINKTVDRDIENDNKDDKHGRHNNIMTAFVLTVHKMLLC